MLLQVQVLPPASSRLVKPLSCVLNPTKSDASQSVGAIGQPGRTIGNWLLINSPTAGAANHLPPPKQPPYESFDQKMANRFLESLS